VRGFFHAAAVEWSGARMGKKWKKVVEIGEKWSKVGN
jgi:hypothetical protein